MSGGGGAKKYGAKNSIFVYKRG